MERKMIISVQIQASILFITAAIILFVTLSQQAGERKAYSEIANAFVSINSREVQARDRTPEGLGQATAQKDLSASAYMAGGEKRLSVDFDALVRINEDTVGWIYIEGTPVNYPVLQTNDNSYYLKRSFTGDENKIGAIFLDKSLDMGDCDVIMLFGHNMGPGRKEMFSSLTGYDKKDFLQEHSEIITATADGNEAVWKAFAVVHADITVAEERALYRKQDLKDDGLYNEYIQLIESCSLYETEVTPSTGQRLLMLSTCKGDGRSNIRRLVFACEAS